MKELHEKLKKKIEEFRDKISKYYNKNYKKKLNFKKGDKVYFDRKNITTKKPSDKLN